MHITTFSKVQMNPLCPKQEEIRIEDIAHAQSLMTRANGHFPELFVFWDRYLPTKRCPILRTLITPAYIMNLIIIWEKNSWNRLLFS